MRSTTAWAIAAAIAIGQTVSGETKTETPACGPAYDKIVDFRGEELPRDTPYIASVELNAQTAMVFRKQDDDIRVLVARLEAEGGHDRDMLTMAFWQNTRCRKVNDRCEGACPVESGKQLRCVVESPDPPKDPPKNPPPTKGKGKEKEPHGKDSGRPGAQGTTTIRCVCR
jgi:hypothetical protein